MTQARVAVGVGAVSGGARRGPGAGDGGRVAGPGPGRSPSPGAAAVERGRLSRTARHRSGEEARREQEVHPVRDERTGQTMRNRQNIRPVTIT